MKVSAGRRLGVRDGPFGRLGSGVCVVASL